MSRVWDKVPEGSVPVFQEVPEFIYNTVWNRSKEAVPITSSIRLSVSIQHRLVTDGQMDIIDDDKYLASIASRGKHRVAVIDFTSY